MNTEFGFIKKKEKKTMYEHFPFGHTSIKVGGGVGVYKLLHPTDE